MHTPFHLNGKNVLITGASSGIGKQAAIDCATMGANVIITGRNKERLKETYDQMPGSGHSSIVCDLLNQTELSSLVMNIAPLDGLVNSAGIVRPFPISFLSKNKIDETLHPNFYATVGLTSALLRAKRINDGASLVFLSSITATYPGKGSAMYAASKAGIEAFSKTVGAEYANKKIRANCISPAMVRTPMYDQSSEGEFKTVMDKHVAQYPLGVGQPEDVANAIIFLLSPASRWITGTNIFMDGGFMLSK